MTTTASAQKSVSRAEETVSAVDAAVGSAFIASGIGSTVLGLMVVLAEASADFANSLKFVGPVGPLSGKTTIAVVAYLVQVHFDPGALPVVNAGSREEPLSPALRQRVAELNRRDVELHADAAERFEALCREHGV